MNDIKKVIDNIKAGLSCSELVGLLSHANQSVRGTAVQSLVERFGNEEIVVEALKSFIERAENRKPAMGTASLSHLAMKLLATIDTPAARATFGQLQRGWPNGDRADLEWFLKNG